jgi:DNA-binding response OmpR family regulator
MALSTIANVIDSSRLSSIKSVSQNNESQNENVVSFGDYLKNEGYNTLLAEDGLQALEILKTKVVQLIILDVMMPKLDGIQACMRIREDKNMPIIMLSAKVRIWTRLQDLLQEQTTIC